MKSTILLALVLAFPAAASAQSRRPRPNVVPVKGVATCSFPCSGGNGDAIMIGCPVSKIVIPKPNNIDPPSIGISTSFTPGARGPVYSPYGPGNTIAVTVSVTNPDGSQGPEVSGIVGPATSSSDLPSGGSQANQPVTDGDGNAIGSAVTIVDKDGKVTSTGVSLDIPSISSGLSNTPGSTITATATYTSGTLQIGASGPTGAVPISQAR